MKYSESWASFQPGKPLPRPFRSESTCFGRFATRAGAGDRVCRSRNWFAGKAR